MSAVQTLLNTYKSNSIPMNMEESLHNILDTTIAYEKIALYKGIAGLYYRIAIALVISLFGLLIIDALSTDAIYFDKGFAHMQFTLYRWDRWL